MSDKEILEKVKTALGITGDYHNELLLIYINETIAYMTDAGVSKNVLSKELSLGAIIRGVSDLWADGSGKLSNYFYQRVIQLSLIKEDDENVPS